MKHIFFTLTLFLLALLSTSCGNKKVAYQNPLPMAFGDPFLLKASDGKYYMYGTGRVSNGFKVYSSDDLVTWTDEGPSDGLFPSNGSAGCLRRRPTLRWGRSGW